MLGTRKGKSNPNFKNGRNVGRQDRELARLFNLGVKGETACRACGSAGPLCLHHVIPRSIGTRESRLNILNGLPLCFPCHTRWHRRTLVIHREVFTAEEWAYLSSVQLTGREIAAWLDNHYPPAGERGNARLPKRLLPKQTPTGKRTHCPKGHPYDEANTYRDKQGYRSCRTCHRERMRKAS